MEALSLGITETALPDGYLLYTEYEEQFTIIWDLQV